MSQENVEVVRRALEAFSAKDGTTFLALLHPEVNWDFAARLIDPGIRQGHAEIKENLREIEETWETLCSEPQELIDAGDQVVAVLRMRGRGRLSGVEVDANVAYVFDLIGERIVRARHHRDREEALAAAGLQG
jgi:ketosteroid isomerase-like protein